MKNGVWKILAIALLSIIGTGVGSTLWTDSSLHEVRMEIRDIRERLIRIETMWESRQITAKR